MGNNESKELIVRRRNYAYVYLVVLLVCSILGSNVYFSSLKAQAFEKESSGDKVFSGEFANSDNNNIENEYNNDFYIEDNTNDNILNEIYNSGEYNNESESIQGDTNTDDSEDNNDILQENTEDKEPNQDSPNSKDEENSNNDSKQDDNEIKIDYYVTNRTLDPNKPMVALTFDDGPDPKRTVKLLQILRENNAVASFFDIGELMEKYPEIVKQEIAAGCDVGGHTYSHVNLNSLSTAEVKEEMRKVENAYKNATGSSIKYIRPTYGNANKSVRACINHPIINWSVDSRDWESRNADKVIATIRETKNLDGKIILMHVIYDSTIEAMEKFIPQLIEEGYQLVTISEMAEYKGYETLENGKIYHGF